MARPPLPADWRVRVVACARGLAIGKCEDRPNRGQVPDYCAHTAGGDVGLFWCMFFVVTVFRRALGLSTPLLQSGSCEQQRQYAIAKGALRTRAAFDEALLRGAMFVLGWVGLVVSIVDGQPHAHHTFIVGTIADDGRIVVTGPHGGFLTTEGNAADPKAGASRNGDGAYTGRERGHAADMARYEFIAPEALA